MLKKAFASAALVVLVLLAVIGVAQKGQPPKPQDPFAEWMYPKAKKLEGEERDQALPWIKCTSKDPFEKVWEFYFREKALGGAPLTPKSRSGAIHGSANGDVWHIAFSHDPENRWGILVVRRKGNCVIIAVTQPMKGQETTIVVIMER